MLLSNSTECEIRGGGRLNVAGRVVTLVAVADVREPYRCTRREETFGKTHLASHAISCDFLVGEPRH